MRDIAIEAERVLFSPWRLVGGDQKVSVLGMKVKARITQEALEAYLRERGLPLSVMLRDGQVLIAGQLPLLGEIAATATFDGQHIHLMPASDVHLIALASLVRHLGLLEGAGQRVAIDLTGVQITPTHVEFEAWLRGPVDLRGLGCSLSGELLGLIHIQF